MGLHLFLKTSQTDKVTRKGLKFVFEVCGCWDLTKLPDSGATSSPLRNKKKWGLNIGRGLKRPCQHLGPEFRQLSTEKKNICMLKVFLK
jgi:hypothetical protein